MFVSDTSNFFYFTSTAFPWPQTGTAPGAFQRRQPSNDFFSIATRLFPTDFMVIPAAGRPAKRRGIVEGQTKNWFFCHTLCVSKSDRKNDRVRSVLSHNEYLKNVIKRLGVVPVYYSILDASTARSPPSSDVSLNSFLRITRKPKIFKHRWLCGKITESKCFHWEIHYLNI